MKDFYSILGINKTASDDDIKKAYKKLAREHHPDKGGNKQTFQEIQQAYETLGDHNKKRDYDSQRYDSNNGIPFNFSPFFSFNFNNGNNSRIIKRQDYFHDIVISMDDVYNGLTKRFKISKNIICNNCYQICNICNGNGNTTKHINLGPMIQIINDKCNTCNGSGKSRQNNINCNNCKSLGSIKSEQLVEIDIPKGVDENKKFIFTGWGEQPKNSNELPGDLFIQIKINNTTPFKRTGLDLIYNVELSLKDLIIGKNINIPYFNNSSFNIHTRGFGIINPNKQYTIFNKGLKDSDNNHGNLHLQFNINFPNRCLTQEEINILDEAFNKINL